ncbi:hypothetical protein BU16DRAFT_606214 [Lophium mytilinum]|uniref:Uncharacterized protein n=1 Tax=Lophium mytilinum TaxID=390894 RepID=A0A6A6QYV8_9PEZI|nr:hypothetical protein BU16DRAFT_606214 [Lophium mytilinum]
MDDRADTLDEKLNKLEHTCKALQDSLMIRDRTITTRNADIKKLEAELRAANRRTAELQRQLKDRQAHEKETERDLNEARDHIFRLQPRRRSITETEAQEAFQNLVSSVQRWVENRLNTILDDLDSDVLDARRCDPKLAERFLSLTRPRAEKYFTCADADEFHVTAAIMQYLCQHFFDKDFYAPLDDGLVDGKGTLKLIEEIGISMRQLPREISQCRSWRSETLAALVRQPEFDKRRSAYLENHTNTLTQLLTVVVTGTSARGLPESVWNSMIKPAMELAHELQLSTDMFSVKWTPINSANGQTDYEKQDDLGKYICVNVLQFGKVLKLPRGQSSPDETRIMYLFDICPGLFCQSVKDDSHPPERILCKPRVLVAASEGKQKLAPKGPTVMEWILDATKDGMAV